MKRREGNGEPGYRGRMDGISWANPKSQKTGWVWHVWVIRDALRASKGAWARGACQKSGFLPIYVPQAHDERGSCGKIVLVMTDNIWDRRQRRERGRGEAMWGGLSSLPVLATFQSPVSGTRDWKVP